MDYGTNTGEDLLLSEETEHTNTNTIIIKALAPTSRT